jgi:hypothetical protein
MLTVISDGFAPFRGLCCLVLHRPRLFLAVHCLNCAALPSLAAALTCRLMRRFPETVPISAQQHPQPPIFQFDQRGFHRSIVVAVSAKVNDIASFPCFAIIGGNIRARCMPTGIAAIRVTEGAALIIRGIEIEQYVRVS